MFCSLCTLDIKINIPYTICCVCNLIILFNRAFETDCRLFFKPDMCVLAAQFIWFRNPLKVLMTLWLDELVKLVKFFVTKFVQLEVSTSKLYLNWNPMSTDNIELCCFLLQSHLIIRHLYKVISLWLVV